MAIGLCLNVGLTVILLSILGTTLEILGIFANRDPLTGLGGMAGSVALDSGVALAIRLLSVKTLSTLALVKVSWSNGQYG